MRSLCLGALVLAIAMPAFADSIDSTLTMPYEDLLRYRITVILGEDREVELGAEAIVTGSERVLLDGQLLEPGRDYVLDATRGRLELSRALPGARLDFEADRQPWGLPRLMSLAPFASWQDLAASVDTERARGPQGREPTAGDRPETEQSALRLGGSKSLVLRLGNGEDLALEQSLRLQLEGRLSDSTRVEAVLRDDDLPFQPEGNTERLEELDKVYMRVYGPAGSAQVGDFTFTAPERQLTPFRRDFQGIQGEWRGELGAMGLWLARSRGLFESLEFYGVAGLQGPYELLSALRGSGAVILAGSERVSLNGRELTRGRDNDYVIDYDQGTLTFSSRTLVNEGDIVRVDFRYSQENWRRGAWGASAGGRLGGLQIDLLHFQEEDDPESPLAFALDAERRAALAAAGDSVSLAITSGVIERPGEGRYIYTLEDPSDPFHYVWVDSLGDFDLRFREVGGGRGDYSAVGVSADGERIFAYAGEGGGAFVLGEQLSAPEAYRLESLRLGGELGGLAARGEFALSDRDGNLLSSRDDGDNGGLALRATLAGELARPAGRPLGLELDLDHREAEFHFPGARRGVAEYRRWNLPWLPGRSDESSGRAQLAWGEDPFAQLRAGAEGLRLGGRFEGLRGELGAGARRGGVGLRGEGSGVSTEDSLLGAGRRAQALVELRLPLPLLRGLELEALNARQEFPDSLDPQRAIEQRGNHERRSATLSFGSRRGRRPWRVDWREEEIRGEEGERDRLRRIESEVDRGLPGDGRLGLSARYQSRRGSLDNEQFQAEARASWLARPGRWGGEGAYRLGSRRQRLLQSQLVHVGFGQGDLNEDGVYVGEGEGDYRRLTVLGEESVRTQNLELDLRVQRPEGRGEGWQRLGSETRLLLREENRDEDPWSLALLDPSHFRVEDATLLGSLDLSQELRYRPGRAGLDFRYRFRLLERLDARDSVGSRSEDERGHRLRTRRSGARGSLELTLFQGRRERSSGEGLGGNFRVTEWGAEFEGARHLPRRFSLRLGGGWSLRRDALRELELRELSLEPGVALSPVGSLRLEAAWELRNAGYAAGDPEAGRPWFFDAPGWNRLLRLEASVQAGANLTLSARYELREEADADRRQRLRLESRAFF